MRLLVFALILLSSLLFLSCDKKIGVHPTGKHLPSDDSISFKLDFKGEGSLNFPTLLIDEQWSSKSFISDTTYANNFDGLPPTKMDIDPLGNIYIIQKQMNRINVYDSNGIFKYQIGRSGRGPGEFHYVFSFSFNSDYTKLFVLDVFDVEIFELVDGSYNYARSFNHDLNSLNTICLLNDDIYISGFTYLKPGTRNNKEQRINSYPIQKFDKTNYEHVASFGFEYRSFSDIPQFNKFMSRNVLACNQETNTIVGQMKDMPYMFGYSPDGEIKWISTLKNYQGSEFTETADPAVTPTNDEVFYHFQDFREIHNSKYELIQVEYREPYWYGMALARGEIPDLPAIDGPEYNTLVVDTETGELFLSGKYGVIGAIRDKQAALLDVERKPFGRDNTVILYEY